MAYDVTDNVEKVIVKLTYLGIQDKPVPSFLLSAHEIADPLEKFGQYDLLHANDEFGITNIIIAPATLEDVVEVVEQYAGGFADESTPSVLAVTLVVTGQRKSHGFELSNADARVFFDRLRQGLISDQEAVKEFDWWRERTNL